MLNEAEQIKCEVFGISGTDVTARLAKFFMTSYVANMLKLVNQVKVNYLLLIKVWRFILALLSLSVTIIIMYVVDWFEIKVTI